MLLLAPKRHRRVYVGRLPRRQVTVPGETYERSASLRMASDSAAAYGQVR